MIRSIVRLATLITLIACGDNTRRDPVFEATSGSRLKLEWHQYADGTRQPEAQRFYDTAIHARCTPQRWIDDVIRCVPEADAVVYVDAACTMLVGRGRTDEEPTHFIDYDRRDESSRPSRVFFAGAEIDALAQYYEMRDGSCSGPLFGESLDVYYELGDEIAGFDLVVVQEAEVGEARLGLRVRETEDGLRVPLGLHDRDLDVTCTPALRPDADAVCEPIESAAATDFSDPACALPVVTVADPAAVPKVARVIDPAGCASYFAVGAELPPVLYRRDGDACIRTTLTPPPRVFGIAARIELPTLGRTVEAVPDRRLQRIILDDGLVDGALRFASDRLFDTATRAECRRHDFGELSRCIPAATVTATALFTPGCAVVVQVAEIPQRTCDRIAFATAPNGEGLAIHAIGDRVSDPLHHYGAAQCEPYTPVPGSVLRSLGPPLLPEAFLGAVTFGER